MQVDFRSEEYLADPYATYARLRTEAPVFWNDEAQHWILSRYQDILETAKNWRAFSSLGGPARGLRSEAAGGPPPMVSHDPPEHTRLRSLVGRAFTPRLVEERMPRIKTFANDLIDEILEKVRDGGSFEFVESFAAPLPVFVIAEILGVPKEMHKTFKAWSDAASLAVTATSSAPDVVEKVQALHSFLGEAIEDRRRHPKDDLITGLVTAFDEEGLTLTEHEIVILCQLLLVAGNETTTNLLSNGIDILIRHPEQYQRLRGDTSLVTPFIEEALRYEPPVQGLFRHAPEDVELGGQAIQKGQRVWMSLAAANRDPEKFPEPDSFVMTRANAKDHLAFGFGIHYCIGSVLARVEGKVGFEAILDRLPTLRLAEEPAERMTTPLLRGFNTLPLMCETN